jgi:DNA-binding CsgD family transcriptional regulator
LFALHWTSVRFDRRCMSEALRLAERRAKRAATNIAEHLRAEARFRKMLNPFPVPLIDRVAGNMSKLLKETATLSPSPIERLSPAIFALKTKPSFGALTASLASTVPSRWEPSVFSVIRRMRALPDLLDRLEQGFGVDLFERLTREDIELLLAGPPANADEETSSRWGQALWRLTAGMGLYPRQLGRYSSTKNAPPELRARQRIYNTALVVAAKSAKERQPVRIGTKWVTDERGRERPIIPAEELTTRELWRFLRARGFAEIPGGFNRRTRAANSGRVRPVPPEEQLATPMPEEEPHSTDPEVARLLEKATPRQREVFRLLGKELTLAEVARRLGIAPSTARVQWWRLQRKARTMGRR